LAQEDRGDNPGRDGNKKEAVIGLHPMIATGRSAQAMTAPIVDYVLAAAIFGRETISAIEVVVMATLAPI
jgi:hypothetical protein